MTNLLVLAVLCVGLSAARKSYGQDDDRSGLQVAIPSTLGNRFEYKCASKNGKTCKGIRHSEALFGIPEYGGALTGQVFYATPMANETGCTAYEPHPDWKSAEGGKFILMVDRGNCNFVQKVRFAEQMGAMGVIVVDNKCKHNDYKGTCPYGCKPSLTNTVDAQCPSPAAATQDSDYCTVDGKSSLNNPDNNICALDRQGNLLHPDKCTGKMTPFPGDGKGNPCHNGYDWGLAVMADDGTGHTIAIPSYLISHYDGQLLKNQLCGEEGMPWSPHTDDGPTTACTKSLVVTMRWELPAPTANVDWSLWTSSEDWHGATFKQEFKDIAVRLAEATTFTPYYFFYDGTKFGCHKNPKFCGSQCIPGGRYCRPDPDGELDDGISGGMIATENLRQLCLWSQHNTTATEQAKWWNYVNAFSVNCFGLVKLDEGLDTCAKSVMAKIGLSVPEINAVQNCVTKNSAGESAMLQEQIEARKDKSIITLPTVMVRNRLMVGGTQPLAVLKEICKSFLEGSAPDACAAVLDPLGMGQDPAGTWSVETNILFEGLTESEFDYNIRQNFKQRLGLEIGVVYSSIYTSEVVVDAEDLLVTVLVGNLKDESKANKIASELNRVKDEGYFTLMVKKPGSDDEVPVRLAAGNTAPKVMAPKTGGDDNSGGGGVPVGTVVVLIILCLGGAAVAVAVLYRRAQERMRAQVRNILAEYMPLEDTGNANNQVGFASRQINVQPNESETAAMI